MIKTYVCFDGTTFKTYDEAFQYEETNRKSIIRRMSILKRHILPSCHKGYIQKRRMLKDMLKQKHLSNDVFALNGLKKCIEDYVWAKTQLDGSIDEYRRHRSNLNKMKNK